MGKYRILIETNTEVGKAINEIPDPSAGYIPVVMANQSGVNHVVGWARDVDEAVNEAFFSMVDDAIFPYEPDRIFMRDTIDYKENVNVKADAHPRSYIAAGIAAKFGAFVCEFDEECFDIEAYLDGRKPDYRGDPWGETDRPTPR